MAGIFELFSKSFDVVVLCLSMIIFTPGLQGCLNYIPIAFMWVFSVCQSATAALKLLIKSSSLHLINTGSLVATRWNSRKNKTFPGKGSKEK